MSETVGSLDVRFSLDDSALDRGLRAAGKKISAFESAFGDSTDIEIKARYSSLVSGLKTASRSIDNFNSKPDPTVEIKERGAKQTTAAMTGVSRVVSDLGRRKVMVRVSENGAAKTAVAVNGVTAVTNRADGQDATVKIGERGAAKTFAAVNGITAAASRANGLSAIIRIAERGAAKVIAAMSGVTAASNRANGQDVTINVNERGSGATRAALTGLGGSMRGVGNAAAAMDDGLSIGKIRILAIGGAVVTVAALFTPFLGGLAAVGALAAGAAGGLGLLAGAFAPTVVALANHEEATKKVATAQKSADTAAQSLADAQTGLKQAVAGVAEAQSSAAEGVASAQRSYQDALGAVSDAEKGVAEAAQGVGDARRDANEGVASAVQTYEDSLGAVSDAEGEVAQAAQGVRDARREANEGVQSAVQTYQDSLRSVEDAEADVAKAARGVRDARREANEGVAQAQAQYQDSLRSVADAERSLQDSRESLGGATRDLRVAQQDLNQAMQAEPRNQAYATLDLADARDRASDATREYNDAVKEYGAGSEEATDALRAMKRAELDLQQQEESTRETRKKGSDEFRSAQEGVKSASEAEKQAREGVTASERALSEARSESAAAYKDISKAQQEGARRVADAQEGVADAQRRVSDAVRDANEAQAGIEKARVDGARKIADAQQQVADAQDRVSDAVRASNEAQAGIEKARIDGARNVADAQAQVADAQDQVTDAVRDANEAQAGIERARIDGAKQVADAQAQVTDAQLRVARATEDAAAAQQKLAEAGRESGAALTASQQAILDKLGILKSQFSKAFAPATEGMNALAAEVLGFTAGAMPALGATATRVMGTFGAAVRGAMSNFSSGPAVAAMQGVLAGMAPIIGSLTAALFDLSLGLIGVFAAATPAAISLAGALAQGAASFSQWALSAKGQQQVTASIAAAVPVFQALGAMVMQVGGALYRFGVENAPAIATAIGVISSVVVGLVNTFAWLTKTLGASFLVFAALTPVVIVAIAIFSSLVTAVMGIAGFFSALIPVIGGVGTAIGVLASPVGLAVAAVALLVAGFVMAYRNIEWFRNAVNAVGSWLAGAGVAAFRFFYAALTADSQYFRDLWGSLWGGIKSIASGAWNGIKAIWSGAGQWFTDKFNGIKNGAVGAATGLKDGVLGRLGELKNRGLNLAGNLKAGALSRFQEMKAGSHGRIGQLVAGGISRFVNLQKRGLSSIGSFVVGGLSKYQEMRKGGATRFEALKGAITNRLGVAKTQGLARIKEFGAGAMSRWTNQWNNAKTRYSGIRDTIGTNLRKGKEWGTNRIKELGGNLIRSTGNQLGNARDKYSAIADTVNTNLGKARKWGSNRVRELGGNLKDSFGNMLEGAKTFGRKWAGHVIDGIRYGVNKARKWMGGLMTAVGNVLGAIGADKLAGAAKERGAKLKTPLEMAKGGVVGMRDGGMASSPTVLYGEAGPEAYVRLDKRTPESQKAFSAAAQSPNAPREYRRMARGGINEPPDRRNPAPVGGGLVDPNFNPGSGEGLGATMHTYIPEMQSFVRAAESKFPGITTNTYSNHPAGFAQPYYRERSVDLWGEGGRGAAIGTSRGDSAANWAIDKLKGSLNWLIWNGRMLTAGGWGPDTSGYDHTGHVHITSFADGSTASGASGSAGGGGGFDWMSAITSGLSGIKKPAIGAGMLGEAFGGFGMDLLGKAKDWLIEKAKGIWGSTKRGIGNLYNNITEGGANRDLGKKMLAASGVPGSWDALENLWTKESNWDEKADNPTSDAYGIPQANPGSKMASHGSDWLTNPKTQIAWGLDYIRDHPNYGSTDAAWAHSQNVGWYARGGVHDEVGRGQVTSGITAIAGEAGTEAIVPMERKTPEGQHALRTALTGPNAPREYRRAKKFASGGMNWGLVGSDRYVGFGGSTRYGGYLSNALDAWNGLGVVGVGGGSDINVYDAYLGGSTLGRAYSNGNIALNTSLLDQYPSERIQSTVSHEVGHILDLPHQGSGLMSTPSYPGRASFPGGREQSLLEGIYGSAAPERGNETHDPPKSGSPGGLSGGSGSTSSSYSSNKISMSGGGKQSYSVSSSNSRGSGGSSGVSTGIGFARNIISNVLGGDANLKRLANNVELWGGNGNVAARGNLQETGEDKKELQKIQEILLRTERQMVSVKEWAKAQEAATRQAIGSGRADSELGNYMLKALD